MKAGDVDAPSWKSQTEEFWSSIKDGWNKTPKYFSSAQLTMLELRRNVNVFSAFKNHANVIELAQKLVDENGKKLTFSAYKKLAQPIQDKYYDNWFKAEYNLINQSAKSAAQWLGFKEKGGMLEYKTIGDGRVRDEHRRLEGTILPVEHPFWKMYYPPNGWNCRCFVRSRPADTDQVPPQGIPDVLPMFKGNVGETGHIFTDDHPFVREIGSVQAQKIKALADAETLRWEKSFITSLATENIVGKTVKAAGAQSVTFTTAGINSAIAAEHASLLEKNRAILGIEQRLKDAQYIGTNPSDDPTVRQLHYWTTSINGQSSYIIAKELTSGEIEFDSITDSIK